MWRSRWGPKGGAVWIGETPWGPRLILAADTKLPSKKTEECNTGRYRWSSDKNASFALKSVFVHWSWPTL